MHTHANRATMLQPSLHLNPESLTHRVEYLPTGA